MYYPPKALPKNVKEFVFNKDVKEPSIYDLVKCATQESTIEYVKTILSNNNIEYFEDEAGNIFNLNNVNVPLLSAHMDTVGTVTDYAKAYALEEDSTGIISTGGVCGGDDKCGVYIILNILVEKAFKINFIFSTDEEIGCLGIMHLLKFEDNVNKIENNCLYCLVLDRKGDSDIVCYLNYYGTKDFDNALVKVSEQYAMGFNSTVGLFSDADYLCEFVSTANISVGYYNPHTSKEYIDLVALDFAEQFVRAIMLEVKDKFAPPENNAGAFGSQKWYDRYYNYEYEYNGYRYGYDEYQYPKEDDYDYLSYDKNNDKALMELIREGKENELTLCDGCGDWFLKKELISINTCSLPKKEFEFCPNCAFDIYDELGNKLRNVDIYAI